MITEDFVSFESAKLLKEKGFDEKCSHYWQDEISEYSITKEIHKWTDSALANTEISSPKRFSAPTLQMAMKWLRKEHNLYIDVLLLEPEDGGYGYVIQDTTSRDYLATSKNNSYQSPEEACEEAIKYCLENLI